MTLSPSEDRNIKGIDGPKYPLNKGCAVAGCNDTPVERHHAWRKSDVIGDRWWVQIGDKIVGNCIGFCHFHHVQLTDNICRIKFDGMTFTWRDPTLGELDLNWQPPTQIAGISTIPVEQEPRRAIPHDHDTVPPGEVCPSCHRKVPIKKEKDPEEKRLRATWCVSVPMDQREDGAETIGTLLEEARIELGRLGLPYGEQEAAKFFVLSSVLALFVQHANSIMSDG